MVLSDRTEPARFDTIGWATAVGFGSFLSEIAVFFLLLFRRKMSTRLRVLIIGILILAGIAGTVAVAVFASF